MKKSISIILVIIFLLSCDLSTSIVPTQESENMAATVNAIMTTFPTIENLPTKKPTSQPTLLAPIPTLLTPGAGTLESTPGMGTLQATSSVNVTETITVTPSITPTITPTFLPEDPRSALGSYSWVDTYTNGNNWPQGSDKYTSVQFEDGKMKMMALSETDGWRLTYPSIKNFYLEASFQTETCDATDHFGIIFRVPDISAANQGYFYGIQCGGKYFFRVFAENVMTSIVFPKNSSAINVGKDAVNRLGIMAEADKMILYVNGIQVREITDTHFTSGGFGIFIGSDTIHNFTVSVDEIAYWTLP